MSSPPEASQPEASQPEASQPEASQPEASRPDERLRRREAGQTVVVLGAIVLACFAWRLEEGRRTSASRRPAGPTSARFQVDLNGASVEELMLLPGIGPALARRIVEHRRSSGPFPTLEALDEVQGIGAAKLAGAAPYLTVAAADGESAGGRGVE